MMLQAPGVLRNALLAGKFFCGGLTGIPKNLWIHFIKSGINIKNSAFILPVKIVIYQN